MHLWQSVNPLQKPRRGNGKVKTKNRVSEKSHCYTHVNLKLNHLTRQYHSISRLSRYCSSKKDKYAEVDHWRQVSSDAMASHGAVAKQKVFLDKTILWRFEYKRKSSGVKLEIALSIIEQPLQINFENSSQGNDFVVIDASSTRFNSSNC